MAKDPTMTEQQLVIIHFFTDLVVIIHWYIPMSSCVLCLFTVLLISCCPSNATGI